jgi:cytosine/adenosine deaminase-related metal-dependent hydrolase
VVVEDATVGVAAANAAGMWSIGLGPVDRVGAAHLVLPSLIDTHWTDLQTQLEKSMEHGVLNVKSTKSTLWQKFLTTSLSSRSLYQKIEIIFSGLCEY